MEIKNVPQDMEALLRTRLRQLHTLAPGSIGDLMELTLISCDPQQGEYRMQCRTMDWMRNIAGTLHGGMCATLIDQAMGCVAYCHKTGEGVVPTVNLQVSYHRPLHPGEDVLLRIRVISVTKSLMHLSAEAAQASNPEKVCITGTATYFYKPARP